MQFAAGAYAGVSLGSILQDPGAIVDATGLHPIQIELNGTANREFVDVASLSITDTLGQPVTASVNFVNPDVVPSVGDAVRVLYHSQVEFAGLIDHVDTTRVGLTGRRYVCQCADFSQILFRRKVRRSFTDTTIQNVLDSLLKNELLGEPLTIGTIDTQATIHLVDAKSARAFDVCRDMAGAAGQTFYVDFDRAIQMRSSSSPAAPLALTESTVLVEGATVLSDREAYRNVQTVIVTGLPPEGDTALTTTEQVRNEEQIAARAAIEGGTGIYEEIAEVTHPNSNLPADLTILGLAYANIQLSLAGTLRTTVKCQARSYGFRAGQIATLDLPTIGASGSFVIQRVVVGVVAERYLFHELELTSSSVQQRAYESWLKIVSGGSKVSVQIPGALTHSSQLFTTPGAANWTVPTGVTVVTVTPKGAGGGGGGGTKGPGGSPGGRGGNGGKAVSTINVVEGQELNLVIGTRGIGGTNGISNPTDGTDGTLSSVSRLGVLLAQGDGGGRGFVGSNGVPGGASGGIVTVGGGKLGGAGGNIYTGVNPANGSDGEVLVEW